MKRIEIEIDDETDALLDTLMSGTEDRAKPILLRRFVEEGVRDMARSRQFNSIKTSPTPGPNGSLGQAREVLEQPCDEDGDRDDSDPPWKPLTMLTLDEVRAIIEAEKQREREGNTQGSPDDLAPPDPLDAIVGSIHDDPVDDIDEIIYGR